MSDRPDPERLSRWRDQNARFHEELVTERGEGWKAFWGSRDSQFMRYEIFCRYLPLAGASVLDVGCGFGDFWRFAQDRNLSFSRYLGIDLNENILEGARRQNPDAEFAVLDIFDESPPFPPDYIVASGIMAVQREDHIEYAMRLLKRFHEVCTGGFAVNFLSVCSRKPDPRSQYTEPWAVLERFQRTIDWRCLLIHDYRPNDFTLIHTRRAASPS